MSKYRIVEHKGHGLERYLPDPGYALDRYYINPDEASPYAVPPDGWLTIDWYDKLEHAEAKVSELRGHVIKVRSAHSVKVIREYDI